MRGWLRTCRLTSSFSPQNRVILTALKHYGMIVADNGSSWFISGAPDNRWNDNDLHTLGSLAGSDFEAVDESSLQVSANSGQAGSSPVPTPTKAATHPPTAAILMQFHKIIGIAENAQRADKSAMGTINRPLQMSGLIC